MSDRHNDEELIGPGSTADAAPTSLGHPAEADGGEEAALGAGEGSTGRTQLADKNFTPTDLS